MNEKLSIWKLFGIFILLAIALSGFESIASAKMFSVDGHSGADFTKILDTTNNTSTNDIIFAHTTIQDIIITPSEINTEVDQYQSIAQIVTIKNNGDESIQILSIEPNVEWISIKLPPFFPKILESQNSTDFLVFEDAKNLPEGYYVATLLIKTNLGTKKLFVNLDVKQWDYTLNVNPNFVTSGMLYEQKSPIKFSLTNPCDESLIVNISSDSSWMEVKDKQNEIGPYSGKQIEVMLYGIFPGACIGNISIQSENETWRIPIGVFVSDKLSPMGSSWGIVNISEFSGSLLLSGEKEWHNFSVPSGLDQLVFVHNDQHNRLEFKLYDPDGNCVYSDTHGGHRTVSNPKAGTWRILAYAKSGADSYDLKVYGRVTSYTGSIPVITGGKFQYSHEKQWYGFSVPSGLDQLVFVHNDQHNRLEFKLYDPDGNCVYSDTHGGHRTVSNPKAGTWKILAYAKYGADSYDLKVYSDSPLEITVNPPYWNAEKLEDGEVKSHGFTIENTGETPVKIENVTTDASWTEIRGFFTQTLSQNETASFTVLVSPQTLLAGTYKGLITIGTDCGNYILPVSMEVGRPKVQAVPDSINIVPIHKDEINYAIFNIVNTGNGDLTIYSVYSKDDWITIEKLDKTILSQGESSGLSISVCNSEIGVNYGSIYIRTNAGEYQIPVSIVVEKILITNQPPIAFFTYSPSNATVNQGITFDASLSKDFDGYITNYEWNFGDGNITNITEKIITHSYASAGDYTVSLTVTDDKGAKNTTAKTITVSPLEKYVFDTGQSKNPYPSIMGTHKGEIKPSCNINVSKIYTYACVGTGGHTESLKLYENTTLIASGTWSGYQDDWHNITITPSVTLVAGHTYTYTIVTGSYPQIIHAKSKDVTGGTITCTSFVDANGKTYTDWIPAIRLE